MTDEERSQIHAAIGKYGADGFLQAYINVHPKQADRIKEVMAQSGPVGAVGMLFGYQSPGTQATRMPGTAMPMQANPVGVGQAAREFTGVGATPQTNDVVMSGVRALPAMPPVRDHQPASTNLQAPKLTPISDLGAAAQSAEPIGIKTDPTMDVYSMFDFVAKRAKQADVPLNVLMGMMRQESNFDPNASSTVGAKGLVQLMPSTARDRGLVVNDKYDERMDAVKNIEAALAHLKWIKDNYSPDTLQSWMAAYNAGHTRLKNAQWMKMKEPKAYASNVAKYAEEYKNNPGLMAEDFLRMYKNIKGGK